jgi:hypothetical protein
LNAIRQKLDARGTVHGLAEEERSQAPKAVGVAARQAQASLEFRLTLYAFFV